MADKAAQEDSDAVSALSKPERPSFMARPLVHEPPSILVEKNGRSVPALTPNLKSRQETLDKLPVKKVQVEAARSKRPEANQPRTKRPPNGINAIIPERIVVEEGARRAPPKRGWAHGLASFIWIAAITFGSVTGLYAYVAGFDLRHFAPGIERLVHAYSDYEIDIEGPISLSMPVAKPGFSLGHVTLFKKETDGAASRPVATIAEMRLAFHGGSFFEGGDRLNLLQIYFVGAQINMDGQQSETPALLQLSEAGNQLLGALPGQEGAIGINALVLEKSQLRWSGKDGVDGAVDDIGSSAFVLPVERLSFSVQGSDLKIEAAGGVVYDGLEKPYLFAGAVQNYDAFSQGGGVQLQMSGGFSGAHLNASGVMLKPGAGISQLSLEAAGQSFDNFARLLGSPALAQISGFQASAKLQGDLGQGISGRLRGQLGESTFEGQVSWLSGKNRAIDLVLFTNAFDIKSMAVIGFGPSKEETQLDAPLAQFATRGWNGSLVVEAERFFWGGQAIGAGEFSLVSEDGIFSALGVQKSSAGGFATLSASHDQTQAGHFALVAEARGFDISGFIAAEKDGVTTPALAYFDVELEGEGLSTDDVLSSLVGHFDVALSEASLGENLIGSLPELAGNAVRASMGGNETLTCFLGSASFDKGRMTNRGFVMETPSMVTTGAGIVDLAADDLKFVLRPRPKDPRQLAKAVDIQIGGAISAPIIKTNGRDVSRGLSGSFNALAVIDGRGVDERAPCSFGLHGN